MDLGLETVDMLARLQLRVRRLGGELRITGAPPRLRELIALAGLEEALGLEPGRQPEERKERLRVEEERELDDLPT